MIILLLLNLMMSIIESQVTTSTTGTQTCTVPSYYSYLNFNQTFYSNNSTICGNVYNTIGSCVPAAQTAIQLNNFTAFARFNSVNAYQYIQMITNMTIYWAAYNGFVTGPLNSSNSFSKALSSAWNSYSSFSSYQPAWVTAVQTKALNNLNSCFSINANITIGLWCEMTSNQNLTNVYSSASQLSNLSFAFSTSSQNVTNAFNVCLPLLDVYCMMSYGISISNSKLPFNNTFNFSDNLIPLQTCTSLSSIANFTDSVSNATRTGVLIGLFNTNRLLYVPDFGSLNNLAKFMISYKDPSNFTLASSSVVIPKGARISYDPNAVNLDFLTVGMGSNITGPVYGAWNGVIRLRTTLLIFLLGFLVNLRGNN